MGDIMSHTCGVSTASAENVQIGGTYYRDMGMYQKWKVLRAWETPEQFKGYLLGEAIGYLSRFNSETPGRGGLMDIEKAHHTLGYLIEVIKETEPIKLA